MSADGLKLVIHFGEAYRVGGALLSDVLMDRIGDAGVRAAALLRGVEGFGIAQRLRTDRLLTLSEDLPLVAVAVDRHEVVAALADALAPLIGAGMATLERVALDDAGSAGDPPDDEDDDDDVKLTFWCGRGAAEGGAPLTATVLARVRAAGLVGGVALAGVDGVLLGERRRARMSSRNAQVPALVLAVGPRRRAAAALPALRAVAGAHVITLERVRVVRRDGRVPAELPALPASDPDGLALWQRVTVHCGEGARWEGHPLHSRLIRRLREAGAAGATALRGLVGYTDDGTLHADRLLSLRRRAPILVTVIDSVPEVARLWPIVARATAAEGLVTAEIVPAMRAAGGPGHAVGGLRLARAREGRNWR